MPITIQTGAHQFTKTDITKYSLMLGGLNVRNEVLKQYDPLVGGYPRLFMVRKPQCLVKYFEADKSGAAISRMDAFKHILEYANNGISGLGNQSVTFGTVTGGFAGKKFEIPTKSEDGTDTLTIKIYEFSGSPVREMIHTWVNFVVDEESGFAHYGGLIAAGTMGYSQANHTAEFIYTVTDRTGMKVEFACQFCNCFPKEVPVEQFNCEDPSNHEIVELSLQFATTKYCGVDVNEKAKLLLKNHQIMVNSLEYWSGLSVETCEANPTGYDPTNGELSKLTTSTGKLASGNVYRTAIQNTATNNNAQELAASDADYMKPTPSYTMIGNRAEFK